MKKEKRCLTGLISQSNNSVTKWTVCLGILLIVFGILPPPVKGANWNVNIGPGAQYFTQSSLNASDIGTNNLTINQGDTIAWTWNDGGTTHTVTTTDGISSASPCSSGANFDSGFVSSGTFTSPAFTAATPAGNPCKFYCQLHANPGSTSGMIGHITINATSGGGVGTTPAGGGTGGGDFETTGLFDADAVPDLVIASAAIKKIQLYPMTAGGSFVGGAPPVPAFSMSDPDAPQGVAAGNFNNNTDAFDDIVVLDKAANGSTYLSVYYGNRAGSFATTTGGNGLAAKQFIVPKTGGGSETLTSVTARDVNGDGRTDLIVTIAPSTPGGNPTPKILLGNGDGTFTNTTLYIASPVLTSITVSPASATITGPPRQYTATGIDQLGSLMTGVTFTWTSSDPAICAVDSTGLATGISVGGPIAITASSGTISGTANCTVGPINADVKAYFLSATLSGSSMFVSDTIFNSGQVNLPSVDVGLYLSPDAIITGSGNDILIGKRIASNLAVNGSSSATTVITLSNIPTGNYYVGTLADYQHKIIETDETNNTGVTTGTYLVGPDLINYQISGTISGTNIYLSDTQQNIGNESAGPFTVSFYFTAGTTPNPSTDTLIGSRSLSGLAGGSATNSATTIFAIPITAPAGTYHVCAMTDSGGALTETHETNNNLCTSTTYTIGPDLITYQISGSLSGTSIYISDTQQNLGNKGSGTFVVTYYFTQTISSPASGYSTGTRNVTNLAGGSATNSATTVFPIPSNTPVGVYYVCAVSDSANTVIETNEANNILCTTTTYTIGPDLTGFQISAIRSGNSFYISDTEQNIGNIAAGAFTASFYLSTTPAPGPSKILLGSRTIPVLAGASATNSATTIFTIPAGVPAGNYYIVGVADSGNVIAETNESNNTLATAGIFALP